MELNFLEMTAISTIIIIQSKYPVLASEIINWQVDSPVRAVLSDMSPNRDILKNIPNDVFTKLKQKICSNIRGDSRLAKSLTKEQVRREQT